MNRILSGMQPTGNLHLGNYLGALKNWVKLQDSAECYYCIVDLHAITVPQDPQALKKSVRETAAAYIACGIDTRKSTLFVQSAVPAHTELGWILSTHTSLGWLTRMTQFKDEKARLKFKASIGEERQAELLGYIRKVVKDGDKAILKLHDDIPEDAKRDLVQGVEKIILKNGAVIPGDANLGLFSYPVLMAADILIYKATHVPVGQDQKQHLELARDIAGAFNRAYKTEYFRLPEPQILGEATRIMSLSDGTRKMSKSDPDDFSRINLTDDADTIAKKFRKAKSETAPLPHSIAELENRPEADNLITILAALSDSTREIVLRRYAGAQFSKLKSELTEVAVATLAPITAKMRELMAHPEEIDQILIRGAEHANALANKHMRQIKEIVGLWSLM